MAIPRWRKLALLACMLLLYMAPAVDAKKGKRRVVKEEPEEEDEDDEDVDTGLESSRLAAQLVKAVSLGDLDTAKQAIKLGANPNSRISTQQGKISALLSACAVSVRVEDSNADGRSDRQAAMVKMLLKAGANVNAEMQGEKEGVSCLVLSTSTGNLDLMKALLEHNASLYPKSKVGMTSLHAACQSGKLDAARMLIDYGADPNRTAVTKEASGFSALMAATQGGHTEVVKFLIEKNANVNATVSSTKHPEIDGSSALTFAALNGRDEVASVLLAAGADANVALRSSRTKGLTPLMIAAREGKLKAAEHFIAAGADINAQLALGNQSVLLFAVINGHSDVASALLEAGATPNTRSERPSDCYSAADKQEKSRERIRLAGAKTAIDWAIGNKMRGVVKVLIERGAAEVLTDISWKLAVQAADEETMKTVIGATSDLDSTELTAAYLKHLCDGEQQSAAGKKRKSLRDAVMPELRTRGVAETCESMAQAEEAPMQIETAAGDPDEVGHKEL